MKSESKACKKVGIKTNEQIFQITSILKILMWIMK